MFHYLPIAVMILYLNSKISSCRSCSCFKYQVDLVPKEVVAKWLKHLRRSFPAIAFKASTQENSSSIKQTKVKTKLLQTVGGGGGHGTHVFMEGARGGGRGGSKGCGVRCRELEVIVRCCMGFNKTHAEAR